VIFPCATVNRELITVYRSLPCHMEVQIFGTKKNADARRALRFFAERRVKTHFVDLAERAASLGELKRFAQKFGVGALIDKDSKRYVELGLAHARYSDERWLERLAEEPLLLRQPLVRWQQRLTVGAAEDTWKEWIAAEGN
jgi:arsenate reductase-like glutaredoxin family protein